MAEVLVGQSYFLRLDPKLWEAMQPYPPLGSLYAAAWLRREGFSVAFFDAMLSRGPEEWDQALHRHQPRFAVLCEDSFNYLSKMCLLRMRQAALEMVAMARRRGCTVIVSGSDAADRFPLYLAGGADFVVIGEAEITLGELLASLTGRLDTPIERIQGVRAAFLGPETFRPRGYLTDLDLLPFPAWDLVDMDRYRDLWRKRHGYFSLNLVTTRGCPYGCNWCAKPVHGRRYHSRSPENVVAELQWLRETAGPDHIWFADDIFGLKPGWTHRFSDLVRARGLQTPFKCLLRTDLVTAEIAADLRRAGCRTVWMGAESGSQKILDAMEKSATVEDTVRATALLREAGIEVGYFLQFGYPGEDWDDIQATFRLVREKLPDDIGVSVSYPLPGTPFSSGSAPSLASSKTGWTAMTWRCSTMAGTRPNSTGSCTGPCIANSGPAGPWSACERGSGGRFTRWRLRSGCRWTAGGCAGCGPHPPTASGPKLNRNAPVPSADDSGCGV